MDIRTSTAAFYDLSPAFPPDIPFYRQQISRRAGTILELGCGTGRVTAALAPVARFIHGVDHSPAMIGRCQDRLFRAGIPGDRAVATVGDITDLHLPARFDLIIAPFHVFQNLATDAEVQGLFETVRSHLAPGGRCILNTFQPLGESAALLAKWRTPSEDLDWEVPVEGGMVRCYVRRMGASAQPLVLYPDLIYRRYRGERVESEAVASIVMRCWYPEELRQRVYQAGFAVIGLWGGYQDEAYGEGPELVVAFAEA